MSYDNMTDYATVRDSLETFDIVLWSDGDKLAHLIQWGTMSKWTHVGMVVRFPGDVLMLWESTFNDTFSGVHMTPLSQAIETSVCIRRLTINRTTAMWDKLMAARKDLDGRPFENNVLEFICAAYDGPFGYNKRNISSLFCSELIAETYQRVGLLDPTVPSNEYIPNDFSAEAKKPLQLLNGAILGEELIVTKAVKAQVSKSYNKAKPMLTDTKWLVDNVI